MVQSSFMTLLLLPVLALSAPHVIRRGGQGGQVSFKNSCSYDVKLDVLPGPGCSAGNGGTVKAGGSWTDTVTECSAGNTALKVYSDGADKPMQFEYGLANGNVWYDMSFIDCVSNGNDFSQCAGDSWAMSSNSKCAAYQCSGGEHCCTQGYCDPNANAVDPDPNAGCGSDQGYSPSDVGINIELCG